MREFEPEQVAAFNSKTDFLNEELKKTERNIRTKIEILTTYVAFLKSSLEVQASYLFCFNGEKSCNQKHLLYFK